VDINQTLTMNKSIYLLQGINIELFNVNTLEVERETRCNDPPYMFFQVLLF